jgi:DNA-binding PadR family transcriptional regulator
MNNKQQLLSSLDVFLLALIDSGVATAYAMREQAGISVGASRPSLQRLLKLGFVEKGKAEARNKIVFRLTRRGCQAKIVGLDLHLGQFCVKPPSEPESIVRIVSLAAMGGKKAQALRVLTKAAEDCRRRAKDFDETTKEPGTGVAGLYQAMMACCSSAELHALSSVLTDLASQLRKSTSKRAKSAIQHRDRK